MIRTIFSARPHYVVPKFYEDWDNVSVFINVLWEPNRKFVMYSLHCEKLKNQFLLDFDHGFLKRKKLSKLLKTVFTTIMVNEYKPISTLFQSTH